jgi:hypothetical protein
MLRIERTHVKPVQEWDRGQFSNWLLTGITVAFHKDAPAYSFHPLHYLFLPSVPVWDTLCQIHDALDARAQAELRAGIASVISNLRPLAENYPELQCLCSLAREIRCIEASEPLVRQVGYEGFGSPVNPKAADVFALVLGTLASMASAEVALRSLEALSSSPWFRPEYAPTTLVALARGDWNLLRHLDRLHFAFDKLERSSPRLRQMYAELVAVVPLSELARRIPDLLLSKHKWLVAGLIEENGPLDIEDDERDVWLVRNDDPTRREVMPILMECEYLFFAAVVEIRDMEARKRRQQQEPNLFADLELKK